MKMVFDIETVGKDISSLSESQREYIFRYAEKEKDEVIREEKIEEAERYLSLYPFTAQIASIGMLNVKTEKSLVMYNSEVSEEWVCEEKNIKYVAYTEAEMLANFWNYISKCDQVITFNGKHFDIPFLMLRSAILKIKPTRDLLKNRYNSNTHLDLLDKLTYFGSVKKFNLDFYCQSFGIESPKSKGISGMDVKELFNAGRVKDIAVYCGEDVLATYKLFKIYSDYLMVN
ncbi:MAG: ribonuclease H-like domain-containing protein [Melioribacteraceae bacterium]|nr:ribonuclease H-like domain-containing protein [Melioribacteraceae bacterium]